MDVAISSTLSLVNSGAKAPVVGTGIRSDNAQTDPVAVSEQRVTEQEPESSAQTVEQAASSIQGYVQSIRRDLNFAVDDSSGRVVVKVTDSVSGDVIRQIPSEDALKLAENLEAVRSLLFKAEA
ncbi:flagellar protein FlaG [Pseudomonas sp. M30-35]|uniref:flagellar protein FlaG n=1 Tax=Pseudomonas sp. M30-35 TaxID=1981174 RepID=UPI000B3CEAF8|nr:flagellar protein FlaG [Pseudomonas sp. M30-35]ARU89180.1 flagellar biosynthesis protein FlaG [Pseudomonas sp. M30-35]